MILLTRINGQEIYVNADVIKFVERSGDTRITFLDDTLILVREDPKVIKKLFQDYKKTVCKEWQEEKE